MEKYIGTKALLARTMNLGDYNVYRGWTIPLAEDPDAKGYLVKYSDGYESWSPADAFEESYKSDGNYNFGHAMFLLEQGYRVQRTGWNGKGMFLFKVQASHNLTVNREPLLSILGEGAKFSYQSHIDMFTADGTIVPWLCSQTDMQASDWQVVPDADH